MKLAMLATTAITTTFLIPAFSADSLSAEACEEMLSIRNVVVFCKSSDRSDEINKIYREVLGRDAEPEGLKAWSEELSKSTLRKIRREIAESDEARHALNRIYQEVLGRNVDKNGLKTYTKTLKKDWSLNDVRSSIQQSEEARQRIG
jgi:hypothetical protein